MKLTTNYKSSSFYAPIIAEVITLPIGLNSNKLPNKPRIFHVNEPIAVPSPVALFLLTSQECTWCIFSYSACALSSARPRAIAACRNARYRSDGAACPAPERCRRDAPRAGGGHVLTPLRARVSTRQERIAQPLAASESGHSPQLPRWDRTQHTRLIDWFAWISYMWKSPIPAMIHEEGGQDWKKRLGLRERKCIKIGWV